mgnify:CR=1 FL=1
MIRSQILLGRTPALAALAVLCLVLLGIVAIPIYGMFADLSKERAAQKQQLAVYRAEIAAEPALLQELADLKARARNAPGLVRAPSADLAAAQIQSELKTIVSANGGEIRSAQTSPAVHAQGFETISVTYDLTVPLSHLRGLLYAVEVHTPYLVLDDVSISAPQTGGVEAADPVLSLRWTVHGYRWAA